ncbi:concanavalin A-like lectin/glucanase domain-containing protein [Gigaspora rosea]|uniref:Concanavalin A-like lectin/glucanase domain-containing protein n=1 Tax=Gigaspora rosea TaxID=44941 RepID=A0A397W217_9GLOM|nr:concanavalin A-like lectin/glucanase domain-containing protein [Gigaspora rosea]
MESSSKFLEICGSRMNYKGEREKAKEKEREREREPNDYKSVALAIAKDQIPLQNGFFYFEVEIINKEDDGIIGVGLCRNPDLKEITKNSYLMPGQDKNSWGYHDDGYLFISKNGRPYGPPYATNDTIGCYLNFEERIMFYTYNGANIGIACNLSKASEDLEGKWYPYVGLRSQGGSIEVNFGTGDRKFKYSAMNNDDIGEELYGVNCLDFFCDNNLDNQLNNELDLMYRAKAYLIMKLYKEALEDLTKVLEKEQNNLLALTYRGKAYFIIGKYKESLEDLTKVLNNESENTIALRYRAEIYQIMKKYYESSNDLKKLLKIRPYDEWAIKARDLVDKT